MTSLATRCFGSASCPCSLWVPACWAEAPCCWYRRYHHYSTDFHKHQETAKEPADGSLVQVLKAWTNLPLTARHSNRGQATVEHLSHTKSREVGLPRRSTPRTTRIRSGRK